MGRSTPEHHNGGRKVLLAMSGGVDSSVAAVLLREQGYEVVGCFMRLGSDDSVEAAQGPDPFACDPDKVKAGHQGCCSLNDASDARIVAAVLGIPLYVMNFRKDFDRIIDYFVDEYNAGRTPNPCIRCNTWLKFGKLIDYANSIDADYVATGHYARIDHSVDPPRLLQGMFAEKDQSYVLFGTRREVLSRMLLPIGEYTKPQIRAIAEAHKLPVFDKPDSQEICFVPDNDYARLVERMSPEQVKPGPIVDHEGNTLGEHPGHQHFTIGQRRGLDLSLGYPIYVVDKDAESNTVTVASKEHVFSTGLIADQTNWLIEPPEDVRACSVKIRSNGVAVPATVQTHDGNTMRITFDEPQRAVSPGQAAVCYEGDQVIGGGWIVRALQAE